MSGKVYAQVLNTMLAENEQRWKCKVDCYNSKVVKEKWQQKFNSSHLKEIQKQSIEVYYKIFKSVFLWRFSHLNQRTVRHLGLILNLIEYVLLTSQEG